MALKIPSFLLCENGKYIIMDHKPLVVIFKKDIAILSQRHQWILSTHQYRVRVIYKPGPDLFMADWLSQHNHNENKDKEIIGMQISINTIQSTTNIPEHMTMHVLQQATSQDQHLQCLMEYVIQGQPESKSQLPWEIRTYWAFRNDMAVTDGVVTKGRCIVILEALQKQVLKQLHVYHMGIKI